MVNDMSAEMDTIEHELEDSIASLRNAGLESHLKDKQY